MTEQPVIVQRISWADLCPWTLIFKTLPISTSVPVLLFALLGVVLTPAGWMLSEALFVNQEVRNDEVLMDIAEVNRSPYRGVFLANAEHTESVNVFGLHLSGPRNVFHQLVRPFQYLFDGQFGLRQFLYLLLGCVWSIFVWSFVGLAITRTCLMRLTRNEQVDLDDAFDFALEKWMTAAGAVGIPLLAVGALCVPAFIIGLMMGLDFGVLIAGIIWILVLAIATAMGLLLLGLMFGWPLMVSSVGCESQNSFDAMTRAYAYTFQRPLNYLFYCFVAILFGGFCWMVVAAMTDGVIGLSSWATSWGANIASADRMDIINGMTPEVLDGAAGAEETSMMTSGRTIIGLWNSLLRTLSAAFIYGLFWCMASAIYLLLRKDVDETEMDEIYIVDEKRTYELPPLKSDENGIPQVQTPVPVEQTPARSAGDSSSADSDQWRSGETSEDESND